MPKRIILITISIILILSFVSIFLSERLITKPYNFAIERDSQEWKELTTDERKEVFEIPGIVLYFMTTNALIKTVLENPYLYDIFIINKPESMLKKIMLKYKGYGLQELCERKDASFELVNIYQTFKEQDSKELGYKLLVKLNYIELLLLNESVFPTIDIKNRLRLTRAILDNISLRNKYKSDISLYSLKLLVKIMETGNYLPVQKLIEEYKKNPSVKIDVMMNPEYLMLSELKEEIIKLSKQYLYGVR